MLSAQEIAAYERGQTLKRIVRGAGALNDLYDDVALGDAVGVGRGAVNGWWKGAKPAAETIPRLAEATGLSADELWRFLYAEGPLPTLPEPGSAAFEAVEEGMRRDRQRPQPEDPDKPSPSPRRRSRGSGAGRG